jgi:hypothetical protein
MSQELAEKFIEALYDLEKNRDTENIAALFAEKAELNNVATVENSHSLSLKEFWTKYRETFGDVKSEFTNKIYGQNNAALEWRTIGTNFHGSPVEYEGVSILEFDGDKISRFFAYFDPVNLGRQMDEQTAIA